MLEPLSIAEKAVQQSFLIQRRLVWQPRAAFVAGAGPLGLLAAALLRLRDMEVFVAATRSEESLKANLVRSIGARYVNVGRTPIRSLEERFDLIVEATGSIEPAIQAIRLLRRNGVMVALGDYPPQKDCENFGRILREMVLGNRLLFGSVNSSKQHFEMGIAHMKKINSRWPRFLASMITKRLPLEQFETAFHPDREEVKTVITIP